jgi:class 3 adenylate cyclase
MAARRLPSKPLRNTALLGHSSPRPIRFGRLPMKRKIAAILAADVAGYSKLVAEDEEETLRRLASYRAVMDDFIARAGGRIFNTAGDAVLAEFSSAVEAVRCAIDIQESLRTRNMAYPQSRQMCFRIGITVGDVVERDGDLLGDGVNIAARLEGIAPVGGICISRSVHEQVANKLSVQFADIGEQQVKNIPNPVHAYKIEMRPDDIHGVVPPKPAAKSPPWLVPVSIAVTAVAAFGIAGVVFLTALRPGGVLEPPQPGPAAVPSAPLPAPIAPSASPAQSAAVPGKPAPTAPQLSAPATSPPQPPPQAKALDPDRVPFILDRARATIRDEYLPAPDHKALAISFGPIGMSTGQASDEAAEAAALDVCQRRADTLPVPRKCELYAVGDSVVYAHGQPPMPPQPWFVHDPSTERRLIASEVPLTRDDGKARIERAYLPARPAKALALSPQGGFFFYLNQGDAGEAARRALEVCGSNAGVPCMIVAVNDDFVVPVPATMRVTGFFHAASATAVAPELREDVARSLLGDAGWSAVAVGAAGRAGLALHAANEQAAIDAATADCAKRDASCHVIAIGPFAVEPK